MESGLGMAYPYRMSGPGNTWLEVWVQNAGCRRPTLYARESVCRVTIDAIVNQCKLVDLMSLPRTLTRLQATRNQLENSADRQHSAPARNII